MNFRNLQNLNKKNIIYINSKKIICFSPNLKLLKIKFKSKQMFKNRVKNKN